MQNNKLRAFEVEYCLLCLNVVLTRNAQEVPNNVTSDNSLLTLSADQKYFNPNTRYKVNKTMFWNVAGRLLLKYYSPVQGNWKHIYIYSDLGNRQSIKIMHLFHINGWMHLFDTIYKILYNPCKFILHPIMVHEIRPIETNII